jgi:hypothetical protein
MRRIVLVAGALVLPLLAAAPAQAATNTICVNLVAPACNQNAATITDALLAATVDGTDSLVLIGPGTYTDSPWSLTGAASPLVVRGSGQGTVLAPPGSGVPDNFVVATDASVEDLRIEMPVAASSGDLGLWAVNGAAVSGVTVDGTGTSNTTGLRLGGGATVASSSVQLPLGSGTRGVFSSGGNGISDTVIHAARGFDHSGANTTDTLSRVRIQAVTEGIVTDSGTVVVDDALIDLGSGAGAGLAAVNFNPSTALKAINANHVTIVGGGAGSKGAWAYAANPTALQTSTIQLDNSIVRGPQTDLVATAGNTVGPSSIATITASYSDWSTFLEDATANGVADVVSATGNLDVAPGFVNAASGDYRLSVGSPVVDKGDPAPAGPPLDLDGLSRVFDGDRDGTAVRDMGAYELQDTTAPDTTILTGPSGPSADPTPTFTFTSEAGATFECTVDGGVYAACTGPGSSHTTGSLADGAHTFFVRAKDAFWGNADATPATRSFTVDTVAPQTTITTKPAKRTTSRKVKLRFTASEAGVTFECKLDGRPYRSCTSPTRYHVKLGKHLFSVRATDAAGNVDATPAKYRFKRIATTT